MSDGLSTEDKITLCIIRNYLDFKVSLGVVNIMGVWKKNAAAKTCHSFYSTFHSSG